MSRIYPGGFITKNVSPTSTSAPGIWTLNEAALYKKLGKWPGFGGGGGETTPPVAGYIGWYDANSFTGTQWTDKSGNGNHATLLKGTPSVMTQTAGNGSTLPIKCVAGTGTDGIRWPTAILPSTYTLFHVARYRDSTKGRIFTGNVGNWLSGFWSNNAGVAYHEGWITPVTDVHGYNWVYSADQNSFYRSNGTTRGTSGGTASTNLSILYGNFDNEVSIWQVAEVIVYNSTLSLSNIQSVESYIKTKYGL